MSRVAILLILALCSHTNFAFAEEMSTSPKVYVFGSEECRLCRDEIRWLFNEGIEYQFLNTSSDVQAREWYEALLEKHQITPIEPITIIGSEIVVGYENELSTGHDIDRAILRARKSDLQTVEEHLNNAPRLQIKQLESCEGLDCDTTNVQSLTVVPGLGLVNLRNTSVTLVGVILAFVSMSTLLNIGWLFITIGILALMSQRLYLAGMAALLMLAEVLCYFYFFKTGYHYSNRFLLEATYAGVLQDSLYWFWRDLTVLLYAGVALIDNTIVSIGAFLAFPYLQKFDDEHPGSIGTLSLSLLFIGGVCVTYFLMFP